MFKKGDILVSKSIENTDKAAVCGKIKKHHESGGRLIAIEDAGVHNVFCKLENTNEEWFYNLKDVELYNKPVPLCPVIAIKDDKQGGVKHDSGKPRMELLPAEGLEDVAAVFAFGAKKYGDYNWRGGIKTSRLIGALLRHVFAYLRGETNDPESGLPHLAHAGCNILMALTMNKVRPDLDDRYKDVK